MSRTMTILCAAAVALAAAACSNKIEGKMTVDGQPFEFKSCRSGKVYGFVGVELSSKNRGKLRIASTPTGEASAFYMPQDATTAITLGKCGTLQVKQQSSEINGVKNVKGNAKLDCTRDGHSVKGDVKFSNCH